MIGDHSEVLPVGTSGVRTTCESGRVSAGVYRLANHVRQSFQK